MVAHSTRRLASVAKHITAAAPSVTAAPDASAGSIGPTPAHFEALREDGVTLVDRAVPAGMLARLREAAEHLVGESRRNRERGGYAMRHGDGAGPWGIRGTYDPAWGPAAAVFAEYMAGRNR